MSKITFLQAFLILLLAIAVGAGAGYLITYYLSPSSQVGQLFTRITVLFCIGLGVGVVCRFAIPARLVILKILFCLLGSISSLLILDAFFSTSYSFLANTSPFSGWAAGEYTQTGLLLAVSLFITLIGKKKAVITTVKPSSKASSTASHPFNQLSSGLKRNFQQWKTKISSLNLKPAVKKIPPRNSSLQKSAAVKTSQKTNPPTVKVKLPAKTATVKKTTVKKVKSPARATRKHAKNVKLVGTEEHRCPYCLEEVKKNDPRGVVICPDCGTWHHKDCWDVTGSCQIAHKHAL